MNLRFLLLVQKKPFGYAQGKPRQRTYLPAGKTLLLMCSRKSKKISGTANMAQIFSKASKILNGHVRYTTEGGS